MAYLGGDRPPPRGLGRATATTSANLLAAPRARARRWNAEDHSAENLRRGRAGYLTADHLEYLAGALGVPAMELILTRMRAELLAVTRQLDEHGQGELLAYASSPGITRGDLLRYAELLIAARAGGGFNQSAH